jgi:hypothetical protein
LQKHDGGKRAGKINDKNDKTIKMIKEDVVEF